MIIMQRILAGLALSVACGSLAHACPLNLSSPIKAGHYGAKSVRAYKMMVEFQDQGRVEDLKRLVREGELIELPKGKMACIRFGSRVSYRHRITVPGLEGSYWVHLDALD